MKTSQFSTLSASPSLFFARLAVLLAVAIPNFAALPQAQASDVGFQGPYAPANWTFSANGGGGSVITTGAPSSITLNSGNAGSRYSTDYTTQGAAAGLVSFSWAYTSFDSQSGPRLDPFGYLLSGNFTQLSDGDGENTQNGTASFSVLASQTFGFRINTDGIDGGARSIISLFVGPSTSVLYWLGSNGTLWSASNNWSSNATGTPPANFTTGSDIIFSATGSSNSTDTDLGGNLSIGSLTINSTAGISGGNLTVSGATTINTGTLTIGNGGTTGALIGDITNNATLVFNRSNNSTYSGNIDGTGNVNKLGNGTLTLNASNTYTGATTLSAGTLALGNADALSGSTLDHSNNATLRFSLPGANTYNIGGLAGNSSISSISIGNNTLSIGANNESTAFSGAFSGTGSIIKSGTGALTLSGSSTYNGTTSLNAGTLQIGSASGLGSGGNITFGGGILQYGTGITADVSSRIKNSGSVIRINTNGNDVTFGSSINGTNTGGLSKLGTGTLNLTGNNSYTGGTVVASGTLTGNNLGLKGNITNNATLLLTNGSSYQTEISGTGNLLVANSAALLGNATMSGGTTIQSGTLTIGGRNSAQTFILGSIAGDVTNGGALRFDMNTGNRTYSGVISGNGSLVSTSSGYGSSDGILYLTGNNTFSGGTTFSHGTLNISGGSLASSGNVTILGGTFDIGASNQTIGNFKINGAQTTAAVGAGILTASSYDLQQGTVSLSLNGAAGLAKNSVGSGLDSYQNGVVHLSGNNTATGNITVSSGILSFNTVQSLYSGNNASWTPDKISASANSTLALGTGNGSATSGFSDAQIFEVFSNLTQNGTGGLTAGSSIGFNVASGIFTLNSTISDRADLGVIGMDKIGAGALVLGSSNTFTGPINIYEGTIRAGTDYALSNSTSLVVSLKNINRPSTYDIGNFTQQFVNVTLLSGILNGGNGTINATGN